MAGNTNLDRICFDRILPRDLRRFASPHATNVFRMAVFKTKKWPVATTLRVAFLEGDEQQQKTVKQFAPEWCKFANLNLQFVNQNDAEVRIAFQNDGAWSYIGSDARDIPRDQPTMNFGWLDRGVVLHEFGHAIGLIHEHQNPNNAIKWNKEEVYKDLEGSPNFWSKEVVDHNMFELYELSMMNATKVDATSIMMYPIPKRWTTDGFSAGMNDDLSKIDRSFIGTEGNYPKAATRKTLTVNGGDVEDNIGKPGEQDTFQFDVARPGSYIVETRGNTDVIVSLYSQQNATQPIAEDDDGGTDRNARIAVQLNPGQYHLQVRHYSLSGQGKYRISVRESATGLLKRAAA